MDLHRFIFSNQRRYRLQRHLAFWLFWTIFQAFLYSASTLMAPDVFWGRLLSSFCNSLVFLPGHMLPAYLLMYLVVPRYVLRNRYWHAGLWTLAIVLLTGLVQAFTSQYLLPPIKEWVFSGNPLLVRYGARQDLLFHQAMMAGLRGGLTVSGSAVAIKLMKHWYREGQRNLQLQQQATESQLQLLKAQVHPHFLFNTLNNIYSQAQETSPAAAKMLMGLSDMLRYMLYECKAPLVPLAKELRMIEEYLSLEKIRYGNRLELHLTLPTDTEDRQIAPLLLLPLVENAFKHGISQVVDQPWLHLHVALDGRMLTVKLMNSKPPQTQPTRQPGIGLSNLRQRLSLLYAGKHTLTTVSEADVFIVNLKLVLEGPVVQRAPVRSAPVAVALPA